MATREDESKFFSEKLGKVSRFSGEESDPFWGDKYSILFQRDRLTEFFPVSQMSDVEKMNAIARFSIISSLMMFLYTGQTWPVYIFVIGMGLSMYMRTAQENKLMKEKANNPQTIEGVDKMIRNQKPRNYKMNDIDYTEDYSGEGNEQCQEPTENNPFGNVLITDYERPYRPPACYRGNETPKRKKVQEKYFYKNLFLDVDDIFQKNNGQRQFYTNPITTIPNDQTGFAEALYRVPGGSCKENQANCGGRSNLADLRRNRHVWIDPSRNAYGVSQVYN